MALGVMVMLPAVLPLPAKKLPKTQPMPFATPRAVI
jgi:hypothetical protein